MISWLHVTQFAALAGLILGLVLLLIFQRCLHPKTRLDIVTPDAERRQTLQNGISRLHQVSPHDNLDRDSSTKTNYYIPRPGVPTEQLFSCIDHPSLVPDAVENGWSRFSFTKVMSSPRVMSHLGAFAASDHGNDPNVEMSWEFCEGSSDYMQKIRLNPGLKKIITSVNSSMEALRVIRTALPLPGPHFGNSSFPQVAYFEIAISPGNEDIRNHLADKEVKNKSESETTKLMGEDFNTNNNSESLTRVTSSHSQRRDKIEVKPGGKHEGKNETILLSVGLTGGDHLPMKIPGSFPGSIGFNSSGSVYLNGAKLVPESEKDEWGREEDVIGCGYNPSQKKVFFTVNSKLVHEIHCKTEELSCPLYPTIAANIDIMILVNFGQIPFKFEPGNLQRTPNPCFTRLQENSPAIGYEDSEELFSMGRIDSKWRQWSARRSNSNSVNSIKPIDFDQEYESDDLFEICLR